MSGSALQIWRALRDHLKGHTDTARHQQEDALTPVSAATNRNSEHTFGWAQQTQPICSMLHAQALANAQQLEPTAAAPGALVTL